jgi:hypothetical protein
MFHLVPHGGWAYNQKTPVLKTLFGTVLNTTGTILMPKYANHKVSSTLSTDFRDNKHLIVYTSITFCSITRSDYQIINSAYLEVWTNIPPDFYNPQPP